MWNTERIYLFLIKFELKHELQALETCTCGSAIMIFYDAKELPLK